MSEYIISMKAETVEKDENSATVRITPNMQEVVRCRDCMHYEDYNGCCHRRYQPMAVTPDGFCAWGERRD